jgi:glycosyltransferase involved in cell wall biosynthesis
MKVLLINDVHYRRGGADIVCLNTGDLLLENGEEICYFSKKTGNNIYCKDEKFFINSSKKNKSFLLYLKEIIGQFYCFEAKNKLKELIEKEHPDIAHIHIRSGLYPAVNSTLRKYKIPVIQTIHDYKSICPIAVLMNCNGRICEKCKGNHFHHCIEDRCYQNSFIKSFILAAAIKFHNTFYHPTKMFDGFIFVSKFALNKHIEFDRRYKDVYHEVIYNFSPTVQDRFINTHKRNYFLFFGRLSREKGLNTLVSAFSKLPNIHLKIVGTGTDEGLLKEYIAQKSLDNIEMLGYKKGNELKKIISESSFVIVPSEWYENNPMTIIEAYSMGIPIIGAKIGGIPEIIEVDKTGYIFEYGNKEELVRCIEKANALKVEDYLAMSSNSLAFANKNFDQNTYIKRLCSFYQTIINKKKK